MDFTREPIIETIITPKDGYKLVIRSSKGIAQEEHFLEAVQIVSYGNALFFRSMELPKSFLVPVSDYELIEVRETRVVLKTASPDRAIKIGGGREASMRPAREQAPKEVREPVRELTREPLPQKALERAEPVESSPVVDQPYSSTLPGSEMRQDKKRDRRRTTRRRRSDRPDEENVESPGSAVEEPVVSSLVPEKREFSTSLTSILPPPSQLIAETMHQYRGSELFKDIFHSPAEKAAGREQVERGASEPANEESSASTSSTEHAPPSEDQAHALPASEEVASNPKPFGELFFKTESVKNEERSLTLQEEEEECKRALLAGLTERAQELAPSPVAADQLDELKYSEEERSSSESVSASSHWQEPFGKSRKESRGEEEHPLPL